jgi:hypothetical protein
MAILLSVIFMMLSLFFISTGNGLMSAVFLILSLIAFINHSGGSSENGPDRYA